MNCDGRREQILLYLTDGLDEADRGGLEEHLQSGCPRCMAELSAAREVIGWLPLALPTEPPSQSVRDRLIERIRHHVDPPSADRMSEPLIDRPGSPTSPLSFQVEHSEAESGLTESGLTRSPLRFSRRRRYLLSQVLSPVAAAALAFLVTYAIMTIELRDGRERFLDLESQVFSLKENLTESGSELIEMKRFRDMVADLSATLASNESEVVQLEGSENDRAYFARMLLNMHGGFSYFFPTDAPDLDREIRYALWLETDDDSEPVQAAEFTVNELHPTRFELQLPDDPKRFSRVSIRRLVDDGEWNSDERPDGEVFFGTIGGSATW